MANKYLKHIPQPLLDDFANNRVVPFVGAGFSKNADIPKGVLIPDWKELGKQAAEEIPNYVYDNDPIDTLSYYQDLYSRTKLIEFLMKALHVGSIKPSKVYTSFCELFTGTICTTNFDFLLEDAMTTLNRPISTIVTEDRLTINANSECRILKLHGDFNHPDKMVITEHDYDMYLEKNPVFATYVSNLFIANSMLLIGYSLDDADFRGIWKILNDRLGGMTQPAYCITVEAGPEKIERYKRRNIRVINLPGKAADYKNILEELFVEIKEYIDTKNDKDVTSSDERVNEQMVIPPENNRLCFISCSTRRIARLSAMLNPVLFDAGITPARLDDIILPGQSILEAAETIIRKSKMVIVDITDQSPYVRYEYREALRQDKNTLIICDETADLHAIPDMAPFLLYSFDFEKNKKLNFEENLMNWIKEHIPFNIDASSNKPFANAHRLYELKEFSACIISAFSELEHKLRDNYRKHSYKNNAKIENYMKTNNVRPHPTMLLSHMIRSYDSEIMSLRIDIVHGEHKATAREAKRVLTVIERVNDDLEQLLNGASETNISE